MAKNECDDVHCAVHGGYKTHGAVLEGEVVSDKARKMVVVERNLVRYLPKYERYIRTRSKIHAHNPDCQAAKVGDTVKIEECRRISKTKAWVITKIVEKGESS